MCASGSTNLVLEATQRPQQTRVVMMMPTGVLIDLRLCLQQICSVEKGCQKVAASIEQKFSEFDR